MEICGQKIQLSLPYPLKISQETNLSLLLRITTLALGIIGLSAALGFFTGIIPTQAWGNTLGFTSLILSLIPLSLSGSIRLIKKGREQPEISIKMPLYEGEENEEKILAHYTKELKSKSYPSSSYVTHTSKGQVYYIYKNRFGLVGSTVQKCNHSQKGDPEIIKGYRVIDLRYSRGL